MAAAITENIPIALPKNSDISVDMPVGFIFTK